MYHQCCHCPGAAARAARTSRPWVDRKARSAAGILDAATRSAVAAAKEMSAALEICETAAISALGSEGSDWSTASVAGCTSFSVAICVAYLAWSADAWGP